VNYALFLDKIQKLISKNISKKLDFTIKLFVLLFQTRKHKYKTKKEDARRDVLTRFCDAHRCRVVCGVCGVCPQNFSETSKNRMAPRK